MQLAHLALDVSLDGLGYSCDLIMVVYSVVFIADNAHGVKFSRWSEPGYRMEYSLDFNVQLRLMLVLVVKLVAQYAFIRLTDDSNQKIKQNDHI